MDTKKLTKEELMQRLAEFEREKTEQKEKKRQYLHEYRQKKRTEGLLSTNIFLADDVREWLAQEAARTRENHSEIINRVMRAHIKKEKARPAEAPAPDFLSVDIPQGEGAELAVYREAIESGRWSDIKESLAGWLTDERAAGRPWEALAEQLNGAGVLTEKGRAWNKKSLEVFHRRNRES